MPLIFAGVCVERENRAHVKIVETLRLPKLRRPWPAITGAEVDEVGFGIVGHAIPDCASAAVFPPFAGPGLGGIRHGFILEALRRIARDRIEAPCLFARLYVIRGDVSTYGIFRAGIPDDDFVLCNAR